VLLYKRREGGRVFDKAVRAQEVQVLTAHEVAAQPIPLPGVEALGQGRRRVGFDSRARQDIQALVRLRHVKVIDRVAPRIGIGKQPRRGIDVQLEADEALARPLPGLHPDLHDAFAHRFGILVFGEVADLEQHQAGNLNSSG
jgi:hypothetical protein